MRQNFFKCVITIKIILENLQCFQEFIVFSTKKLRFRVNENQVNLKLKERERHMKVEARLKK